MLEGAEWCLGRIIIVYVKTTGTYKIWILSS